MTKGEQARLTACPRLQRGAVRLTNRAMAPSSDAWRAQSAPCGEASVESSGIAFTLAPIAAIQGTMYLTVLSINPRVLASRGLAPYPGELVMWGPLAVATTAATLALLIRAERRTGARHRVAD